MYNGFMPLIQQSQQYYNVDICHDTIMGNICKIKLEKEGYLF